MAVLNFFPGGGSNKLPGSVSASPSSVTAPINGTATAALTVVGDGALSASSSDTSVATVAINGLTLTVTGVAAGNATITVNLAASSTYTKASCTVSVSVAAYSPVLADNTPGQIKSAVDAGLAETLWDLGDVTRTVTISSFDGMSESVTIRFYLMAFDHNSELEGTGVTFIVGKNENGNDIALVDNIKVNPSGGRAGGWAGSYLKQTVCPSFYNALPQEWQNVISPTSKWTANFGGDTDGATTETTETVFPLAQYEVFATRGFGLSSQEGKKQKQYDYYKNGNSRVKHYHNSSSNTQWWLRSPAIYSGYSGGWCVVRTDGNEWINESNNTSGFAPAFRIGPTSEVS